MVFITVTGSNFNNILNLTSKSFYALLNLVGWMLEEKRNHFRLRIDLPVLYKTSDHKANTIKKTKTYDISDSGICFYTDTFHKKGTNLQVTLQNIFDSPKTCTVKWHSQEKDKVYKIGVHFSQNIS